MTHEGAPWCSRTFEDMTERMDDMNLDVTADDVLVLRNAGRRARRHAEAGYCDPEETAQQGVKDMVRISTRA